MGPTVLRAPNLSAKKGGMMRNGNLHKLVGLIRMPYVVRDCAYPTPLMIITNVVDAVYGSPTSSMP